MVQCWTRWRNFPVHRIRNAGMLIWGQYPSLYLNSVKVDTVKHFQEGECMSTAWSKEMWRRDSSTRNVSVPHPPSYRPKCWMCESKQTTFELPLILQFSPESVTLSSVLTCADRECCISNCCYHCYSLPYSEYLEDMCTIIAVLAMQVQ